MKKAYYQKEISKYRDWFRFLLFLSVILFLTSDSRADRTIIPISATAAIVSLLSSFSGIILLYRKIQCKAKGTPYEGRITGKRGISTLKNGYYYELQVIYKNGKIITPTISSKYVDNLKSKRCTVYEYKNMTYVDDYQLCCKGEKSIRIRVID